MTAYNIIARIDVRRALRFSPELTSQALERGLADATVEAWGGDPYNQVAFSVQLKRPTHEQALSEIESLIGQFAFYVAEASVSEIAGDAVETAIIETFGGGGIVTALAAITAGLTEAVAGAEANKIRRDYEARRDHQGYWSLAKPSRHQLSNACMKAGLSLA